MGWGENLFGCELYCFGEEERGREAENGQETGQRRECSQSRGVWWEDEGLVTEVEPFGREFGEKKRRKSEYLLQYKLKYRFFKISNIFAWNCYNNLIFQKASEIGIAEATDNLDRAQKKKEKISSLTQDIEERFKYVEMDYNAAKEAVEVSEFLLIVFYI